MRISIGAFLFTAALVVGFAPCAAPTMAFAFGPDAPSAQSRSPGNGYGFTIPSEDRQGASGEETSSPLPEVHYDLSTLPPPVAAMREKIIAAARSGDDAQLRTVIGLSKPAPVFSSTGDDDPIDILRTASGDGAGLEVRAILLDVLDAGWVVKDEGTPQVRYIWPYFAEFPPNALTRQQLVEVYRVLTAGDFEEMRAVGSYEFYRLEISADGRWLMFMAGE